MKCVYSIITGAILTLMIAISGCGGGGGGGGGRGTGVDESLVQGTYIIHQAGIDNTTVFYTSSVKIVSNGDGTGTFTILSHSQIPQPPSTAQPFTYQMNSDRTFTVNNGAGTDSGIASTDGSLFLLVDADDNDSDSELLFAVGIKQCTSAPALTGNTYRVVMIGEDTQNAIVFTVEYQITINALDNVSLQTKSGPTINIPLPGTPGTISVRSDCTFTLSDNSTYSWNGIVSSDGNLMALVDADTTDNLILFGFGAKESSGLTNSSVQGNYWAGQIGQDNTTQPTDYTSQVDITPQGDGTGTATIMKHSMGSSGSISFTYTVNSDGTFDTTKDIDNTSDHGIISPDGKVFAFVDTNATDNDSEIIMGAALKK